MLFRIYTTCQVGAALILVAFIVGSLVFVGGRVGRSQSEIWGQFMDWPIFPVPAWLLVVPAAVGALVVVPLCVLAPPASVGKLITAVGQTGAAVGAAALFMFLFPANAGVFAVPGDAGGYLGAHWVAIPLGVFSMVVLLITVTAKGREYDRLRASGELYRDGV